jgi:hypothetical protein
LDKHCDYLGSNEEGVAPAESNGFFGLSPTQKSATNALLKISQKLPYSSDFTWDDARSPNEGKSRGIGHKPKLSKERLSPAKFHSLFKAS